MKTAKQIQDNYRNNILLFSAAYAIILFSSIGIVRIFDPPIIIKAALGILTAAPLGGTILVFLKYIREIDEYLKAQITESFIKATGLVLFIATALGFMENYAAVKHIDSWLLYPMFWACFGLFHRNKMACEK